VPGADEKCGYGLLLKTFLNQLKSPVELKQTTFHGHRINLFSMSASGFFFFIFFYHRNHFKEFIEVYFNKEDRNRLVSSVYNYVNNPVYLAGCRALGIIDKLLTGPLWRIIENVEHILDLNDTWFNYFQKMHLNF
jgi:E1A/CREB-binding protein